MTPRRKHSEMTPEELLEYKRELGRIRNRKYHAAHPEKFKAYYRDNKGRISSHKKKKYLNEQTEVKKKQRDYYRANKEKVKAYQKDYYRKNKDKSVLWSKRHIEKVKACPILKAKKAAAAVRHVLNKMATDPVFRMISNLRRRLRALIKIKSDRSSVLIGCSANELRKHVEDQFEPWMNWENYGSNDGRWVLDHILPCASFDLRIPEQQKACFHFSNLRPLCWRKNMEKSDSIITN